MNNQNQKNGKIVITIAIIALIGTLGNSWIQRDKSNPPDFNIVNSLEPDIDVNKNIGINSCQYYKVTRPNGLYLYQGNTIVGVVPHNAVVKVDEFNFNGYFARVYSSDYGFGWVTSQYLYCQQ